MNWVFYAIIVICGTAIFNVLIKFSEGQISPVFGTFLLQFSAFVVVGCIFAGHLLRAEDALVWSWSGVFLSLAAGIVIMLVNFSTFSIFHNGIPLSTVVPFVRTGTMIVSILFGIFLFKENMSWEKGAGILLCLSGIFLLTRDI